MLKKIPPLPIKNAFKETATQDKPLSVIKLEEITNRLAQAEVGKELLDFLNSKGYQITLTNKLVNSLGYCNTSQKTILLNNNFSCDVLIGTLAHEARHAIQQDNPQNTLNILLSPETAIALTYIKEADADAVAALACWQLKEKGDNAAWEGFKKNNPLQADAFSKYQKQGKTKEQTLLNTFNSWFKKPRLLKDYSNRYLNFIADFAKDCPLNFKSESTFSIVINVKDILTNVCGCSRNNYFKDNKENIVYQYMPKNHIEKLKKITGSLSKSNKNVINGIKILFANLSKKSKPNLLMETNKFLNGNRL